MMEVKGPAKDGGKDDYEAKECCEMIVKVNMMKKDKELMSRVHKYARMHKEALGGMGEMEDDEEEVSDMKSLKAKVKSRREELQSSGG